MENQIATIQTKDLLSSGDIEVLKKSKFKDFTENEISYVRSVCSHLQLNPLLNQIHFVRRKDNKSGGFTITIQVGIDGFRLAAERTGKYAGSDEPVFEYPPKSKIPTKATVTVYKMVAGIRCPFTGTARWDEYYPGDVQGAMWKKMPSNQLAKCAEALALRKGFPAELSALRTDEEMAQAGSIATTKASKLNARAPLKEEPIEDAEFTESVPTQEEEPPEETKPLFCCGKNMLLSKYPDRETGVVPYYCPTCKRKEFKEDDVP